MIETSSGMHVTIDASVGRMSVQYIPRTSRTIYDLCDLNGRVVRTGAINQEETTIDITGLSARGYVMLIVDGDQVISKRVNFAAKETLS